MLGHVNAADPRGERSERASRALALREVLGASSEAARGLADGIRGVARRHFDLHVMPLVVRHWPEVLGTPFMDKLRIGACDLYAVAPYTALFCGEHPPLLVRAFLAVGDRLPLSDRAFARLGGALMVSLGRAAFQRTHRQIALVSAFIVVVDHAFDHCMGDPPRARRERLKAIIGGAAPADSPQLHLVRALALAMWDDLGPLQRSVLVAAMRKVDAWIDAEVLALSGAPDPSGLGHRRAGVEGTIEGLLFPVADHAGAAARAWMNEVSMFVQMVDDLLDIEADVADGRATPATEGRWTLADAEAAWGETVAGLEDLVRRSAPGLRRFDRRMVDVYRLMMIELVEAMIARPEDGHDGGR